MLCSRGGVPLPRDIFAMCLAKTYPTNELVHVPCFLPNHGTCGVLGFSWRSESHVVPPLCEERAFVAAKNGIIPRRQGLCRQVVKSFVDGVLAVGGGEVHRVVPQAEQEEVGHGLEAGTRHWGEHARRALGTIALSCGTGHALVGGESWRGVLGSSALARRVTMGRSELELRYGSGQRSP